MILDTLVSPEPPNEAVRVSPFPLPLPPSIKISQFLIINVANDSS